MTKTKKAIIENMIDEIPFIVSDSIIPYLEEAMQIYADQESRKFTYWLSNQVINGRTMDKLWIDYKATEI
jgi:hypothetical protein